jgi:hypothetical protein
MSSTTAPPRRRFSGPFAWLWVILIGVGALLLAFVLSTLVVTLLLGGVLAFGVILFLLYHRITARRT